MDVFTTILSNTYTLTDFRYRTGLLKQFLETFLFQTGGGGAGSRTEQLNTFFAEQEVDEETREAMRAWGEEFLEQFTADTVYDTIAQVQEEGEAAPQLTLYVPVRLPHEHIADVGAWLREQLHRHLLLRVRVDPGAVGGCAFIWNGTYYDFSLKYFTRQHHSELRELLTEDYAPVE